MWEYRIFVEGQQLRPETLNVGLEKAQTRERSIVCVVLDDPQLALAFDHGVLEVRVREWVENDVQLWRRPFRQPLPLTQQLTEEVAGLLNANPDVSLPIETQDDLANMLDEWKLPYRMIAVSERRRLVHRDRLCQELHLQHPQYGFGDHKGYATPAHLAALKAHGACVQHRRSFAPVREAGRVVVE